MSTPAPAEAPPDLNEVRLVGRVSGEPAERVLPSGDPIVTFRVVVRRKTSAARRNAAPVDTIDVAGMDVAAALAPFELTRQLSSNRTQGVPNMIALVQDTARRIAAG